MRKDYTDITIVLDRSGSMQSIKSDMEGALNAFFEEQKKIPGTCKVTLVSFNTESRTHFVAQDIKEVPPVVINPDGGTALLDALGDTIHNLGARLRSMNEADRPEKVVFIVITDGEENQSTRFVKSHTVPDTSFIGSIFPKGGFLNPSKPTVDTSKPAIDTLISHQTEKYNWQFVFMGANQDAIQEASSMGIPAAASINFAATAKGSNVMGASLSSSVGRLRCASAGEAFSFNDMEIAANAAAIDESKK